MEGIDELARHLRGDFTTIRLAVSPDAETYSVPAGLLREAVPSLTVDGENEIPLCFPDFDRSIIECFVHFVCRGELPRTVITNAEDPSDGRDEARAVLLTQLWCFGDSYNIPVLQNLVMANLLAVNQRWCVSPNLLLSALQKASPSSHLGRFVLKAAYYDFADYENEATLKVQGEALEQLGQLPSFLQAWLKCGIDNFHGLISLGHRRRAKLGLDIDPEQFIIPEIGGGGEDEVEPNSGGDGVTTVVGHGEDEYEDADRDAAPAKSEKKQSRCRHNIDIGKANKSGRSPQGRVKGKAYRVERRSRLTHDRAKFNRPTRVKNRDARTLLDEEASAEDACENDGNEEGLEEDESDEGSPVHKRGRRDGARRGKGRTQPFRDCKRYIRE